MQIRRLRVVNDRASGDQVGLDLLDELRLGQLLGLGPVIVAEDHQQRNRQDDSDPEQIGPGRHLEVAAALAALVTGVFALFRHRYA